MSKNRKKSKSKLSVKLKNDILQLFGENPDKQLNYKQVSSFLEVSDKEIRKLVFTILNQLVAEGRLKETQRGKYKSVENSRTVEGKIEVARRGAGYVVTDEMEEDVFVHENNMNKAINGDKVRVKLLSGRRNKPEGKVVEVLGRRNRLFVGTLDIQDHFTFLLIDDQRINIDIFISGSDLDKSQSGYKAVAQITDWPDSAKNPFGKIVEILGKPESNEAEMKSILTAYGINYAFPNEVLAEANLISTELDKNEIAKRKDFRDVLTITIDPVDAKDFDDAISIEKLTNGNFRVGVHIADVAHYVKDGSALDKEAIERGNSVYLVDRVIPMLPEHLSNGVCSLRPNEEKFTFSAVFELDENGDIVEEWFGKTVIKSDRRFTYEEAQKIIEGNKGDFDEEILLIDKLAKKLRAKRIKEGALEIHGSELRFELDTNGAPIQVYKKVGKDANKLVEEFMLLANRRVGHYIGDTNRTKTIPFIYRIHDKPDMERVQQFAVFVSKFGKNFQYKNEREIAKNMNELFSEMKDESEFALVQQMAIKTMSKAVYDTENIGHYGLGFRYYAHFTSPIRRYADLMVHRILFEELTKNLQNHKGLQSTAKHISITERRATEAERASKKYFQALYLQDKEGEIFAGAITGLTEWGIYVEMEENFCEGMIPLKSIGGDRYTFDPDEYIITGQRSGEEFNLGDHLRVRIVKVSLAKKQIDLELID
jgi:ribonuclease R